MNAILNEEAEFTGITDSKFRIFFNRIKRENYIGYDPYDGLNSKIFKKSYFYRFHLIRLIWIQLIKRCPINIRRLLCVSKSFNPKAGALFLLGLIKLHRATTNELYKKECYYIVSLLKERALKRENGVAWGYNFDWQAKAFYVPENTPNIVTSVYVGNALLDFYECFGEQDAARLAAGVGQFILSEMLIWERKEGLCFSYVPGKDAEVHNANLMAAAFLSRLYDCKLVGDITSKIRKAVAYSLKDIKSDGYWPYGTKPHHRWMDNFHTAFNLESLLSIRRNLKTAEYDAIIKLVFKYYLNNMFLMNGVPKYYKKKIYPIDIHTIAESIVFLSRVKGSEEDIFNDDERSRAKILVNKIIKYGFKNMWDRMGYFYFQKYKWFTNKIPYMRWSQAWMFYALISYMEDSGDKINV